jgi:hypothetical protein
MWNYTAHRDVTQGVVAPSLPDRIHGVWDLAKSYKFAISGAMAAVLYASSLVRVRTWPLRTVGLVAILLPVAAGFASLLPLHPLFPHYANLLYLGSLLASCVAVRLAEPAALGNRQGWWVEIARLGAALVVVGALVVVVVSPRFADMRVNARRIVTGEALWYNQQPRRDATSLGAQCPAGSHVEVWGWASELYAYYDWVPASRYVNASWVVYPGGHQREYLQIMRAELAQDPPECIVEALGPAFFAGLDPAGTIGSVVPGASQLLESCYLRSDETLFDGRGVTLYRRTVSCTDR